MDFLTQPFTSNRTQPQQTAIKTSPKLSDDSSVLTASTSETSEARQQSNANFEQLRTATEASTLPGENVIQVPSTKSGDWKAYGRVEGRVLLWENGTLKEKKALNDEIRREQWIVSGTLWFTKRSEIVLVLDQSVQPRQVLREQEGRQSGRRLSLSRNRSTSPTNTQTTTDNRRGSVSEEDRASKPSEESSPGFFSKVLDAVRPGRKERRASSSSGGLSLSRSRSRSRTETADPAPASQTHGGGPGSTPASQKTLDALTRETGQLTFEEPSSNVPPSPFPLYKGHPVTALYIASPAHVQSLRFYPQRAASSSSPFFSFSKSSQPLSSPPSSPTGDSNTVEHPVVELDVIDPAHLGSIDEGKKREVTVGLTFVEILCATEAEDFHKILESAMGNNFEENTIHRTVSRSLETGNTQRRKSFSLKG
ncbi:hypothetical protein JCM3765_005873 [Sporobolomyces pararoseus]